MPPGICRQGCDFTAKTFCLSSKRRYSTKCGLAAFYYRRYFAFAFSMIRIPLMISESNIPIESIPGFSEPFSSMSHLFAAGAFFLLGFVLLGRSRTSVAGTIALLVFIFGVTFALSMSGVFHLLAKGTVAKAVFQRLDHAGIFFLIAATYTPVHVIVFRGTMRWGILSIVWIVAITGITLKTIFFNDIAEWVGLSLYLSLGWFGVFSTYHLYKHFGLHYIKPILYGALAYTIGATLEFLRTPVLIPYVIGPHEIFHVFVLVGISTHWSFIQRLAQNPAPGLSTLQPAIKNACINSYSGN
jgi:channel protein (hemolysin III family)